MSGVCMFSLKACYPLFTIFMLLLWPGGFSNGRRSILCLQLTSKTLIFCASGVLIAGKLGFSFGASAVRRFYSNIYNSMYASMTMSLVYQMIKCGYFWKIFMSKRNVLIALWVCWVSLIPTQHGLSSQIATTTLRPSGLFSHFSW